MSDQMTLTIVRSKWLHGEGGLKSELLRESDGKMCCLGFYGIACGIAPKDILGVGEPESADEYNDADYRHNWPHWLFEDSGCGALIGRNDSSDPKYRDAQREADIARLFAKHGVTVVFVDDAPEKNMEAANG